MEDGSSVMCFAARKREGIARYKFKRQYIEEGQEKMQQMEKRNPDKTKVIELDTQILGRKECSRSHEKITSSSPCPLTRALVPRLPKVQLLGAKLQNTFCAFITAGR